MFATFRRFRRAFGLLRAHRGAVFLGALGIPVSAALTLWMPALVADGVGVVQEIGAAGGEAAGRGEGLARLTWIVLTLAGVALAEALAKYLARERLVTASRYVETRLKDDLMAHLVRLPAAWFDRARTGDLISRLTQDVELVRFVVGPALLHGGLALLIVPGGFVRMAQISVPMALVTLACSAAMLGAMAVLMPRIGRMSRLVQEAIGAISQRAAEDFAGVRVLMNFARTDAQAGTMRTLGEEYLQRNLRLTRFRAAIDLFVHTFRNLVVVGVVVLGAAAATRSSLGASDLLEFVLLMQAMVWPLISMGWILATFHRAVAAAERIEEVFETPPEPSGGARPVLRGQVTVQDLTFRYPGQEHPALAGVSFALEPGAKLGLVGPVGSGKSTLLALLLRLYDPPAGTVRVDGHDVLDLDPAVLRATFALAPQDPFLFSDTIAGNVRFGVSATEAAAGDDLEVLAAVEASALDRDLEQIQGGLEAVVGERGITLSGGQKQRVSLARALAANRAALVLDDTLSAVDYSTETTILDRLRRARRGRTMIVASHRLTAVEDSDLILVLDQGRVVERGTHRELVQRGGWYAEMWRRQQEHQALEGGGES